MMKGLLQRRRSSSSPEKSGKQNKSKQQQPPGSGRALLQPLDASSADARKNKNDKKQKQKKKAAHKTDNNTPTATTVQQLSNLEKTLRQIQANDPSLTHVTFWGTKDLPTELHAIQLVQALRQSKNDNVKYLEICENPELTVRFGRALALLLASRNTRIAFCKLISNVSLGDDGVEALCKGLQQNKSVLQLNLDGCSMGDDGACAVGKMLAQNATLFEISVARNPFSSAGLDSLVMHGIANNNSRGSSGGDRRSSLLKFTLDPYLGFDYHGAQAIEAAMLQNKDCTFVVPTDYDEVFGFDQLNLQRKHVYESRLRKLKEKWGDEYWERDWL